MAPRFRLTVRLLPHEGESQKPSRSLSLRPLSTCPEPVEGCRRVEGLLNSGHFDKLNAGMLNDHALYSSLGVIKPMSGDR